MSVRKKTPTTATRSALTRRGGLSAAVDQGRGSRRTGSHATVSHLGAGVFRQGSVKLPSAM